MKLETIKNKDEIVVKVQGPIDEDAQFDSVNLNHSSEIILDLSGVTSINSCGIREWIKWMRTKDEPTGLKFIFCPKVIIDQVNMVSGFIPEGASIDSFYVPFYSEETDTEKSILFKKGVEYFDKQIDIPSIYDEKGNPMELDVMSSKYFKFIKG